MNRYSFIQTQARSATAEESIGEMNFDGKFISKPFVKIVDLEDGFFRVCDHDTVSWGIYDANLDKIIIPCEYSEILYSKLFGIFIIQRFGDGHQRFPVYAVDRYNNVVIPAKYDRISILENKYLQVSYYNKERGCGLLSGIINLDGSVVVQPIYEMIWSNGNGFMVAEYDGKKRCGLVKSNGYSDLEYDSYEQVILEEWNSTTISMPEYVSNGCVDLPYTESRSCKPAYLVVSKQGKFGVVNLKNELIVPLQYINVEAYVNEYSKRVAYVVKKGLKYGLLSEGGELLVPTEYDEIEWKIDDDDTFFLLRSLKNSVFDKKEREAWKEFTSTHNHYFVLRKGDTSTYVDFEGRPYTRKEDKPKKVHPTDSIVTKSPSNESNYHIYRGDFPNWELKNPENNDEFITYSDDDMLNSWKDENGVLFSNDRQKLLKAPKELTHYIIPDGTLFICKDAFRDCTSLKHIDLPNSLIRIGKCAFFGCESLDKICLLQHTLSIGSMAFAKCSMISEVYILSQKISEIEDGVFWDCAELKHIDLPDSIQSINSRAFEGCTSLEYISLPSSVKSLGCDVFNMCRALKYIQLPNIDRINSNTFKECSSLEYIYIPDSVKHIGAAFNGCTSLKTIRLPRAITSFGYRGDGYVFHDSSSSVYSSGSYCRDNCIIIGSKLIYCGAQSSVFTLSGDVTEIGSEAFKGKNTLKQILLHKNISKIGLGAFESCSSLKSIIIPEGVEAIETSTFEGCSCLEQITLPSTINEIGERAFKGCSALEQITLPSTISTIGEGAFEDCKSLKRIIIPEGVEAIEDGTFLRCSALSEVQLPSRLKRIGILCCEDEYSGDYSYVIKGAFADCKSLQSISIPDSVKLIGRRSFLRCTALTEVVLPNNLESVGALAFCKCESLKQIILPKSVTEIGEYCFRECKGLSEVTVLCTRLELGDDVFTNCPSLSFFNSAIHASKDGKCLIVDGVLESFAPYGLSEYCIQEGVTEISRRAFYECVNLKKIFIPDSVQKIGMFSFACCSSLNDIRIPEELKNVEHAETAFFDCPCKNIPKQEEYTRAFLSREEHLYNEEAW